MVMMVIIFIIKSFKTMTSIKFTIHCALLENKASILGLICRQTQKLVETYNVIIMQILIPI